MIRVLPGRLLRSTPMVVNGPKSLHSLLFTEQRSLPLKRRFFNSKPPEKEPPTRQHSFQLASDPHVAQHLLNRLSDLDRKLSYGGWHTLRWTSLFLVVAGGTFWFFRDTVSSGVGDAASEV